MLTIIEKILGMHRDGIDINKLLSTCDLRLGFRYRGSVVDVSAGLLDLLDKDAIEDASLLYKINLYIFSEDTYIGKMNSKCTKWLEYEGRDSDLLNITNSIKSICDY